MIVRYKPHFNKPMKLKHKLSSSSLSIIFVPTKHAINFFFFFPKIQITNFGPLDNLPPFWCGLMTLSQWTKITL